MGTQLIHAKASRAAVRSLDAACLELRLPGEPMPSLLELPL